MIPEGKIAGGKLAQTIAHGARVVQVEGDFDVALALLRQVAADYERYQVYLVNSVNPFRSKGKKRSSFEMLEQLDWHAPDVIALPGGNLGNTAAFGKALTICTRPDLIDRLPRLMTIQAAGAAPFAALFRKRIRSLRHRCTRRRSPPRSRSATRPAWSGRRRAIIATGGVATSVTDDEIMEAKALIDRVGIGCEPASAASLAGVRKLVASAMIEPGERRRLPDRPCAEGHRRGHGLSPRPDSESAGQWPIGPITIPATHRRAEKALSRACGLGLARPASSANLGPGFDALGLALDLWNVIEIETGGDGIQVSYVGPTRSAWMGSRLLGAGNAPARRRARLASCLRFTSTAQIDVPVARGLGS